MAGEDNGNPFNAPLASEVQDHQQAQVATVAASHNGNPFDEPLMSEKAEANANGGPSQEEQQYLQSNPGYKYVSADPKFPNRPEGIYPTGPGNEWRNDPSYSQSPVDLHMLKHTAEYAAGSAAAVGASTAVSMAAPELVELAIKHLAGNVLPGLEEEAAKAKLAEMAPKAIQIVKDWGVPLGQIGALLKVLSLGKGK